jgi:hypothetical protein
MDTLFTYILARVCSLSRPTNSSMRKPKQNLDCHLDCTEETGSSFYFNERLWSAFRLKLQKSTFVNWEFTGNNISNVLEMLRCA